MAQAVIDSLGDNIAALTGYVIQLQDANAEPPAHMAANGQQVAMVTKTLVQVAHNTAATSFKDYAFIKDEIDAEADKVAVQADELGVALNAVMTATDRVDAYGSLLNACKNIAQGTCYLLILVYGGRVKCILLKAEEVKKQIAEVRLNTGEEPSQELINEIQDLTKELATLQKFVLERAGDIVEEDDKEKLQGFGSKIQDARQGSVNSVNNWIGAPDDPEAKKLVPNQMDDVEQLVDDLIHYVDVPDNMNAMKMMEAAFKNKEGRAVMGKSAEQNKKALGGAADNLEAGAQSIPVERGLLGAAAAVARSAAQEVADVGEDPDRVEPEDSPDLTDKLRGLDAASAELIASEPNDKFKDQIANDVGRVDKAADDFDKAAIAAAADPTPEARTVVDKASEELTSALDDLLRNAKRRQDEKERAEREAAQAKLHDAADKVAAAAAAMDPDDPNRGVLEAAQQLLNDTDKTMNDIGAKNYAQLPADAKVEQDDGKAVAGAVRDLEQQLSGKVDTPVIAAVANATKEVVGAANAHAAAANGVASAPNEDARQEQSDVANAEAEHVAEAVNDLLHQLGNQKRAATAKELHDNAHVAAVMARAAEDPETQAYLANAARLGQNAADMLNAFSNDPQSIDANLGNNDDLGKALLTTGTNVANKESNPEMAKAIKENLIKASNAGSGLSDAGHRAKDDPTQEGAFNNAADDFSKALKDIVALEQQKEVADAQEALANAAKAADEAARNAVGPERTMLAGARDVADGTSALMGKSLDPEAAGEVGPDSKALSKQVIDLVHATGDAGDAETNPEEKALLEATKTGMAGDAAAAIKAAKARASNPEDHDATTEMAAKSRALAEKIESLVDHADRARRARDAENALRHRDEPYGKEVGDAYDAIKRALAELHEAGDDPVKVMAATKKAIAAAHKLMDGLDALAAATADPQRKQELANARNAVGDAADGLQRAADAFVANPSDAGAKAALDAAAQGLNDATDNAMRVAGTDAAVADLQDVGRRAKKEANNSPDPIRASALDAGGDVANAAAALLADAKPHGERAADDVAALDEAISVLEAAVGRVSDPDVASKAAADVDAVKAARNAVVAAAEALQTNPNDLAANNAAREDGMALAAAINDLVDDLTGDKAMLARLLDDAAALLRALDDLDDALARGDVAGVEAATKAAVEAARDLCQTLNDLADKEDDPTKKQQLQDAAKAINDGVEELVHDSVAWQADPTNEALKDKLAGSSQHLRDEVNKGVALAASSAARQDLEAVAAQAEAAKQANPDLPASEIAILDAIRDTAGTAAKTAGDTYDNPSAVPADAGQVAEAAAAYGAAAQGVAADNPSSAKGVLKTAENVDDASAGFGRAAEGASARTDDHEADAAAAKTLGQAATRLADTLTSALTDVPNRARTKAGADREAAQRDLAEIAHSAADLAGVDGLSPAHKSLVEAVAGSAEGAADTLGRLGRGEDVEPSAGAAESAANGLGSAPAGAAVKRLVEAARGSAANPGDVGAALRTNAEAEAAVSGLNDVLGDVNNQLRADAIGALEAAADHARGAGMNTTGDAVTGVADMLKALGNGDVGPAASDALAAASRLAATVNAMPASDDAARAARAEQVEAVKSLVNEAVTAGKTAALDPSDVAAAAAANVAAKQLADAATALVDSVVADVAAVNQARRGDIKGRLEAASAAAAAASTKGDDGNTQATDRALAELASKAAAMLGNSPASGSKANADAMLASLAELEQAGSALAAAEKDPSKRQGVEAAVANVVEAARSAAAAAQEAASNPAAEDAALNQAEALADAVEAVGAETRRKRHDNARAKIKAALWALGADDANIEGFGDLLGLANLLGKKMGNLVGDIDGMHEDDVRAEAAAMQEKLREFADKAQELMDGDFADDDEAKDIIARHTAEIRRLVDLGADYANAYAANPTPENDERMVDNAEALAEEIKAFADDCRAYNESHANDPVTSEAVIDKLANEVERTARKYDNDWGDEQIVLFGHTLAELMARLAAAAREGNRPEIIAVVKEIHKIAKQASKEAKGEVANLDDDRLKENVDLAATGMTSFATQLKILGSVKAASLGGPGRDDAAENQLITCCSGVVAAMQNSINGVIAAKVYKRNH